MESKIVESLLTSGIGGIVALIAIIAIKKLYNDMTVQHNKQLEDSVRREEKLMAYLDKKNETDSKFVQTLENINEEISCINVRIEGIEKAIRKEE